MTIRNCFVGLVSIALGVFVAACSTSGPSSDLPSPTASVAAVGDPCVVGRWISQPMQIAAAWGQNGTKVPMAGAQGEILTISAEGASVYDDNQRTPLVGTYLGHQVEYLFRGQWITRVHAVNGKWTESFESTTATVQAVSDGMASKALALARSDFEATPKYSCNSRQLTLQAASGSTVYSKSTSQSTDQTASQA